MNSVAQNEAFKKLSKLKVGALFMEMGTGKTKVALDLINSRRSKVGYVLWICPFSLKNEIEKERQKWYPNLEMEIVGCESIGQSDRIYMETHEKVKTAKCSFLVVDESLKIKNIAAKRTRRIQKLGEMATYKLILNGTPISKNCLDLYPQINFLSPKILDMSYWQFKDTYCEYYTKGKLKGKVKRTHNVPHLVSKIEPYVFEASLDIDTRKNHHFYNYYIDKYEYDSKKDELFWEYYDPNLDELMFYPFASGLQRYYTQSEEKKAALQTVLNKIKDQTIIFVKFLDSIPPGAEHITGDVKSQERMDILHRFEAGEFQHLYMTYGCGSFGLNLQFCKNTVFADMIWDYAMIDQAEARTYRMGQGKDVNYYTLTCGNSGLEDLICENINKKGNLLNEVKLEIQKTKGGVKEWVKRI